MKHPSRTWPLVLTLGIPLAIVGAAAMAISYVTLIDVARVNGLPLPELFPVLIDVGTVATMIAAAQFRLRGITGRWLAYATFIALSAVSIVANASHAGRAADMTVTTPWAAALLAAAPPIALLAITHLVMMLIPDEKERAKLQSRRDRHTGTEHQERLATPSTSPRDTKAASLKAPTATAAPTSLRLVENAASAVPDRAEIRDRVLAYVSEHGEKPTGAQVGEWLGKSYKTGQRFLQTLEEDIRFVSAERDITDGEGKALV